MSRATDPAPADAPPAGSTSTAVRSRPADARPDAAVRPADAAVLAAVPDPVAWAAAGPPLVARAIAELAFEGLLVPEADGADGRWRIALPAATWRFAATRGTFDTWRVDVASVTREAPGDGAVADHDAAPDDGAVADHDAAPDDGAVADHGATPPVDPSGPPPRGRTAERPGAVADATDPVTFLLDAATVLALTGGGLVDAVRDLQATRTADAHLAAVRPTAAALADLSHVDLEAHGDGHPCMLLNKGRLGFGPAELRAHAPEHRPDVRLLWLAVHPDLGAHHGEGDLDLPGLQGAQLDPDEREAFRARLDAALAARAARRVDDPTAGAETTVATGPATAGERSATAADGADPPAETWAWVPVHPFHFNASVAPLHAGDLAEGRLVVLGEGRDRHRPLQSVRTLANVDRPDRHDVKLPLAIRNTLVWRGLSAEHTAQAPRLSAWLADAVQADPFLRNSGFVVLGEVAAVTVEHPAMGRVPDLPYRYAEMGGAVFRRGVASFLREGEGARSMAALTLVGADGRALVAELVDRSGLPAEAWLARFLDALLPPLVHWLVRHGVAFCPHGENTVVLFDERDVPVRVAVKDLAEDVNVVPEDRPEHAGLHPDAAAVLLRWPVRDLRHSLLSAVFAGHFRTFAPLVDEHLGVDEPRFWTLVAGTLERTRRDDDPELRAAFDELGLFDATFERITLNREQLAGDDFHERAERDEGFDLAEGTVPNPLAGIDRDAAAADVDALLDGAPAGRAARHARTGAGR